MAKERDLCCAICRDFNRFYTIGVTRFNETDYGYCNEHKRCVGEYDYCDDYTFCFYPKISKHVVLKNLNSLLTELSEVRRVLEEEYGK